jgi:zinc transport system substrate-binding protein
MFLIASSCNTGRDPLDKPVISVSIIPQKYFIEQLAGDLVEVNVMIPPGASPATYEPTVSQLGKLDRSMVYFRIGYIGFEISWIDKIAGINPGMKIVNLSEGVEIIKEGEKEHAGSAPAEDSGEIQEQHTHAHLGADPHIWMSVINARMIALTIHNELLLMFPGEKEYLQQRFLDFNLSLDSIHSAITTQLEGLENRKFMIYHPALTYYAKEFGLEQFSLEIEGKTPSPAHMKRMIDLSKEYHISKILIQNQFDTRNAKVLASETGSDIIQFDPLDLDWGKQMRYIAEQLNPSNQ